MEQLNFRMLKPDEIDCRVGTVTESGISLLMYKDARVDMRLLDEFVGPMNWKREHELINGNLFCTVSIRDKSTGEWVSKQDVGVESYTEKEKGQASDAFKRACFNWGIGRELYTCPFVWITISKDEWKVGANGKKYPKTQFFVKDIQYNDGKVVSLVIVDDKGTIRFNSNRGTSNANSDSFNTILAEVSAAKDENALRDVYYKYLSEFKDNNKFINAVNARKEQLKAA